MEKLWKSLLILREGDEITDDLQIVCFSFLNPLDKKQNQIENMDMMFGV